MTYAPKVAEACFVVRSDFVGDLASRYLSQSSARIPPSPTDLPAIADAEGFSKLSHRHRRDRDKLRPHRLFGNATYALQVIALWSGTDLTRALSAASADRTCHL